MGGVICSLSHQDKYYYSTQAQLKSGVILAQHSMSARSMPPQSTIGIVVNVAWLGKIVILAAMWG